MSSTLCSGNGCNTRLRARRRTHRRSIALYRGPTLAGPLGEERYYAAATPPPPPILGRRKRVVGGRLKAFSSVFFRLGFVSLVWFVWGRFESMGSVLTLACVGSPWDMMETNECVLTAIFVGRGRVMQDLMEIDHRRSTARSNARASGQREP